MEKDLDKITPREIVQELDKYIIGQDRAKKVIAIALRNRYRRRQSGIRKRKPNRSSV